MIRLPPRSTLDRSSAASDVYKRQKGDGYDVSGLGDRKIKSPPKLSVDHNEIGDVKIKITVDRNGKVTKADYERSGSTITDTYLIAQSLSLIHISEPTRPY